MYRVDGRHCQLLKDWTTRVEQFGPRSQKMETHYTTSNGHQWALVLWFLRKKKNLHWAPLLGLTPFEFC